MQGASSNNRVSMALSCFAWNKDSSKLAVCPNSNEIWIYRTNKTQDTNKWEIIQVLKEVSDCNIWKINEITNSSLPRVIASEPCELA